MSARSIANELALNIVAGKYSEARDMLRGEAREEWTAEAIKEAYEEMVEYFDGSPAMVVEDWDDEFGETALDHGTFVYVPINSESEEESEAISVVIDKNSDVIELEFGRP